MDHIGRVILSPFSFFIASFISKRSFNMFRKQSQTRGNMTGFVNEMLGNIKVVKVFDHGEKAQEEFDQINDDLAFFFFCVSFFFILKPPPLYADSTAHTSRPPVVFRCETAGGLSLRRRNTGERTDYGRSMLGTLLPSVSARTARRMMLS